VTLTAPGNGATVSGPAVIVSANASDDYGVAGVQFKLNGANLEIEDISAPYNLTWDTTTVSDGPHTITAVARDAAGQQTTSTPISIIVSNATPVIVPTVTLAASDASASRVGPDNAAFTITRTGDTVTSLTVDYSLGGTAVNGTDYDTLSTAVTIPAGAASATITVIPKPSASHVGPMAATLTLTANPAYTVGPSGNASVTIAGNSVPSSLRKVPDNNMQITWASTPGKVYRVTFKNSFADTNWTDLSGNITATDITTSWTDTTSGASKQRYYLAYVTN